MPYIKSSDRSYYKPFLKDILNTLNRKEEEEDKFNNIRQIVLTIIQGSYPEELRYYHHNEIIGMLECCRLEWYRRKGVETFTTTSNFDRPSMKKYYGSIESITKYVSILNPGEKSGNLNYFITALLTEVYNTTNNKTPLLKEDLCSLISDVKEYWYEKKTAPYEDIKIKENGDV